MPNSTPLSWVELESRLLNWIRSAHIPRYPFFDGVPSSLDSGSTSSSQYSLSSSLSSSSLSLAANNQDLHRWLEFIEQASGDCDIKESQYADVAVWFMRGELREVMRERRAAYLGEVRLLAEREKRARQLGEWRDFKADLTRVVDEAAKILVSASSQARSAPSAAPPSIPIQAPVPPTTFQYLQRTHPYIASSLTLGLVVGGTVVLLPALKLGVEALNRMREAGNRASAQVGTSG
ncbi:hypothetical protein BDN70DRAFT_876614 [Pholiota conissans]|uniref:Uncharacterized protein n=1 Tax=Pholiota conissans TaxID=109636 RepID=A0A9P5Z5M3_9AGAR|nr:hypothetical protein BDN70DRAFT_876614 [Pholiota conissans]